MQIFYYQRRDRTANFGDQLNIKLWQALMPDLVADPSCKLDTKEDTVLVGLGTLLNHRLPQRLGSVKDVVIFSTGAGYEQPLQTLPPHWRFYCVRGPLTAQQVGLAADLAITDGGILLRRVTWPLYPAPDFLCNPVAFMPHVHHATFAAEQWQLACDMAGLRYVDPRWPVEQVISAIRSSQLLLAEAMHGAITADALGVPWIPLTTSPRILGFKWRDWCASIRAPYRPVVLPPLISDYPRYGRGVRSGLRCAAHWGRAIAQGHVTSPVIGPKAQPEQFAAFLSQTAQQGRPVLSDRTRLENLTQALEEKLAQLHRDMRALMP